MHHMNLAAEAVARILQFGNAQAAPSGGELGVFGGDAGEQRVGAVQIDARAGAGHERAEHGAALQVLFADRSGQRGVPGSGPRRIQLVARAEAMERGKDLVRNFGLHGDQIERGHADGAARAHALRSHVEQLPVQIESLGRAQKAARQHKRDQQLLAHGQGVHLGHGTDMSELEGRTTRAGIRASRAAMASARAKP